jgi:hypothetical protein
LGIKSYSVGSIQISGLIGSGQVGYQVI